MNSQMTSIIIGLAGGLAVGSGLVAFLTVLGIIPRLSHLTRTTKNLRAYEWAIILGSQVGIWFSLGDPMLSFPKFTLAIVGLACGLFIGMLAAALTEVLNVFPILAKRIGMKQKISWLILAIVFGKIFGSLYHWLVFVK
ncbi:stage V sporulation protein AB [Bacillus shivajii]|uniref:stage V sporulation protein AB n=1 Tax=Bacillus shivajii TaxID=1983719 RepID=UPI001CF9FDEA|nr:stage V sporulation protein AB [Bacillus shivajii]UCZ54700.1 stage V sporulation protein AB [Bacillus shivajii]